MMKMLKGDVEVPAAEYKAELAKVKRYSVVVEGHGMLMLSMGFDFGGMVQGFGYLLDTYSKEVNERHGHAGGTDFILRVMQLFKVSEICEVEGRVVEVLYKNPHRHNDGIAGLRVPAFDGGGALLFNLHSEAWREIGEVGDS